MRLLRKFPTEQDIREITPRFSKISGSYLELMAKLLTLIRGLERGINASVSQYGLSEGGFSVLIALRSLRDKGDTNQSELAKLLEVSKPSMTSLLNRLETDGFVTRTADKTDRRIHTVALTKAGRAKVDDVLPKHLRRVQKFIEGLTPDEAELITPMLDKLLGSLAAFGPLN